jgi:hypothetical protein
MQGVWFTESGTPLQRPKDLGAKEFFTAAELAAREQKRAQDAERAAETPETEFGTTDDVHFDRIQWGTRPRDGQYADGARTSLIVGPEGRIPPFTPEAQKRVAERQAWNKIHQFDAAETRALPERCVMWTHEGPPMLPAPYNGTLQIVQGGGNFAILQEMIHDTRIIRTDGAPHLGTDIRQWFGDSRGRWEGDTFVVETANFTNKSRFQNSTENLRVVERFTLAGPETIRYEFTVSDPSTWEKSWSGEVLWTKIDSPIYEYACQEGNYGMANTLRGARKQDAEAAAKKSEK